jgi:hypothetical protein
MRENMLISQVRDHLYLFNEMKLIYFDYYGHDQENNRILLII